MVLIRFQVSPGMIPWTLNESSDTYFIEKGWAISVTPSQFYTIIARDFPENYLEIFKNDRFKIPRLR